MVAVGVATAVVALLPQVAIADAACIVALPLVIDPARAGRAALGAVAVLGEPMHWNLLAGLALVTGGILLGVRAAKPVAANGDAR